MEIAILDNNRDGGVLMKRFLYYFSWVLLIGFICYLGSRYYINLKTNGEATFKSNGFIIYNIMFTIIIGMLLKLPVLLNEIQLQNKWTFDWVKLLALGIPTLYIITIPIWSNSSFGQRFLFGDYFRIINSTPFTTVAGIVLGYCLLDILKKKN